MPTEADPYPLPDPAEWAALGRIGAVNRALAMLGLQHDGLAARRLGAQLDEWVVQAQKRHGIQRTDDLAAYAWFAAEVHPEFDQHPLGMAVMASESTDVHIADLLQAISPEQRSAIRSAMTT